MKTTARGAAIATALFMGPPFGPYSSSFKVYAWQAPERCGRFAFFAPNREFRRIVSPIQSAGEAVELVELETDAHDEGRLPFRPMAVGREHERAVGKDLDAGIGAVGVLGVVHEADTVPPFP